jgi:hypothetical protein
VPSITVTVPVGTNPPETPPTLTVRGVLAPGLVAALAVTEVTLAACATTVDVAAPVDVA